MKSIWNGVVLLICKSASSEKFFVLLLATGLLVFGKIPWEGWITVAIVFMGANVYQKQLFIKGDIYKQPTLQDFEG